MVIMTGYPEKMQQLMQSNPGLQSLFPSKQFFPKLCEPSQVTQFFAGIFSGPSRAVDHQSLFKAKVLLEKFVGCEDFKSKMQQLECSAAELRKLGRPVDDLLSNWLFVGEPRTGMVAPSTSLRALAGVTWPCHVFTCFLLYLASVLAFSLPLLKNDV